MKADKLITYLREKQGMSQAELARRSGITPAGIHRLETGKRSPHLTTLLRILSVFDGNVNITVGNETITID